MLLCLLLLVLYTLTLKSMCLHVLHVVKFYADNLGMLIIAIQNIFAIVIICMEVHVLLCKFLYVFVEIPYFQIITIIIHAVEITSSISPFPILGSKS